MRTSGIRNRGTRGRRLGRQRIDYAAARPRGQDIRFIDAGGRGPLAHEVEAWNDNGISHIWVNVPNIPRQSNQGFIWMYYANPGAPDVSSSATWNPGYRGVWHLSGGVADSTSRANDGQDTATTSIQGQVAEGRGFNGSSAHINIGSRRSLDDIFANGGTIEAWIRPTSYGENSRGTQRRLDCRTVPVHDRRLHHPSD